MKKINIPQVILLCVDTTSLSDKSIRAVIKSKEGLSFGKSIYVTTPFSMHRHMRTSEEKSIHMVSCSETILSKAEYSRYILKNLYKDISPLLDTYTTHVLIVQWDGFVVNPKRWSHDWLKYDYIGAPWMYYENNQVGNGGFSLRSVKLLKLCSMFSFTETHPEDDVICRKNRMEFEALGIKYAPLEEAMKFSAECEPYTDQFGFHDKVHSQQMKLLDSISI